MLVWGTLESASARVDGLVEDGDGSCHTDNNQGLGSKEREDDGAEHRSQEDLVDTIVGSYPGEHVEGESQSRKDARGRLGMQFRWQGGGDDGCTARNN